MQARATSTRASGSGNRSRRTAVAAAISALFLDTFTGAAGVLSAHTSDTGHTWANDANYGSPTGITKYLLDGSGNLITDAAEGTAHVVGLAMPESNDTTLVVNFPAYSNMWFDLYMNATADGNNRIYLDHVFSDADTLEIGGMVVGGGEVKAINFGVPWHVDVNFGVDMTFRYEVRPTNLKLYVNDALVGTMNYAAASVSSSGTLVIDGDTQTNMLLRSIEISEPEA